MTTETRRCGWAWDWPALSALPWDRVSSSASILFAITQTGPGQRLTEREMLDFMQASSFGNFFAAIPEDLHEAFRADFEHAIEAHGGQDGFSLRDYGMLLVARRPLKSPDG